MATKEATVYILDLGETMAEKRYGRTQSDLDWSMEYVWDKILTTVCFLISGKDSLSRLFVDSVRTFEFRRRT